MAGPLAHTYRGISLSPNIGSERIHERRDELDGSPLQGIQIWPRNQSGVNDLSHSLEVAVVFEWITADDLLRVLAVAHKHPRHSHHHWREEDSAHQLLDCRDQRDGLDYVQAGPW